MKNKKEIHISSMSCWDLDGLNLEETLALFIRKMPTNSRLVYNDEHGIIAVIEKRDETDEEYEEAKEKQELERLIKKYN